MFIKVWQAEAGGRWEKSGVSNRKGKIQKQVEQIRQL